MEVKLKTNEAKITSTLMKDIKRIRHQATMQAKMNLLRKHQTKLLNKFIEKLLGERRITKEELKEYMPKKKEAEIKIFGIHEK